MRSAGPALTRRSSIATRSSSSLPRAMRLTTSGSPTSAATVVLGFSEEYRSLKSLESHERRSSFFLNP